MLLLVFCCTYIGVLQAYDSYTITVPNAVIPGTSLGFHVNILKSTDDVNVKVALKYSFNGSIVAEAYGKASKGNPEAIQLQIPESLRESTYQVSVTGSGGLSFYKESDIFFDSENFLFIFIQTDKFRYSGGQIVLLRVILLNTGLQGYTGVFDISIKDPKDNMLKKWLSQTAPDGVFSTNFSLSDEPEIGVWKIVAQAKGKTQEKTFKVSPYTIPKFKVVIDADGAVYSTDTTVSVEVSARFTFKKDVYGNVVLQIYNEEAPANFIQYSKEIQGQASFAVPMKNVVEKLDSKKKIIARAFVTDDATLVTMAAETTLHFATESKSLSVRRWDTRETFVPGIKYFASFSVLQGGNKVTEAGSLRVNVDYTTYRLSDCPYTQPRKQKIIFSNHNLLSETVAYSNFGLLSVSADPPSNAYKMKVKIYKESDMLLNYELKRILPADLNQMVRLSLISTPKIDERANISLSSTDLLQGLVIFEVYSRGRLLVSETENVNRVTNVDFQFVVVSDMIPKLYVLSYYIGNDGKISSDQISIEVECPRLKNNVSVEFVKEVTEVRDNLQIIIRADPGSNVYLLAEDERNRLLGIDNDIFLYQVTDKVDNLSFNATENIRHFPKNSGLKRREFSLADLKRNFDAYGDTDDSFMEAGVILFTDGKTLEKTSTAKDVGDQFSTTCPRPDFGVSHLMASRPGGRFGTGGLFISAMSAWPGGRFGTDGLIKTAMSARPGGRFGTGGLFKTGTGGIPYKTFSSGTKSDLSQSIEKTKGNDPLIRSLFPETWFWESINVGPKGFLTVTKTVPDSVTSWITSAFATNANTGFGVAAKKTKITVSKEFFVTVDMPATIIFQEEFLLQVTAFNYLPETQQVVLAITHSDDPKDVKPQATTVSAGEGHSVFAYIRPLKSGNITVAVRAQAGLFWNIIAQDSIERHIYVQPAGVWRETNIAQMIDTSSQKVIKTLVLKKPSSIVPDTEVTKVSLTGDFMLPSVQAIEGLQDFIRLPFGCGEQTMIVLGPNIYITEYLEVAGKLTDAIKDKSKHFMESGLQRELKYQRKDGSFSAFGDRDPSGSSWLTAFVLKCFHEAKDLIFIDETIMTKAMTWLLAKQRSTGEFFEPGRVIHRQMQSGTNSDIKLTAYILIALWENKDLKLSDMTRLPNAIAKAVVYIETNIQSVRNSYTLALVCYALSLGQSEKVSACENKLKQSSIMNDETIHWKSQTPVSISRRNFIKRLDQPGQRAPAKDIEATAYALMFLLSRENVVESFKAVKWLVSQRNARGGYQSTQDTVVSLKAISEYAKFRASNNLDDESFGIDFKLTSGDLEYTYRLDNLNKDVLHSKELPNNLEEITIEAEGSGIALIEIYHGCFVSKLDTNNLLTVTASIINESINAITVKMCIRWLGQSPSGMIVSEVEMPTGFVPDEKFIKSQDKIKLHEHKGKKVTLYFDGLPAGGQVCVDVKSVRVDPVVKSQACHITVYDYYEPENQAMTVYESGLLKSSNICEVCYECNFCDPVLIGK